MLNEISKIKKEIYIELEILKPEKGLKNIKRFKENYLWALNNIEPKMHVSVGNLKLPKSTLIFNLGTWFNCSGRKKGFCDICQECYDKSPEVRFKQRILDRLEQEVWWRSNSPYNIAREIIIFITKWNKTHKIKIDRIRFAEVGELRNNRDLEKLIIVSNIIGHYLGIKSYIYTHNKELNFKKTRHYLTINGSNFMVDNEYRVVRKENLEEEYETLKDLSNKRDCICDCNKCPNYCLDKNGLILIETLR